MAGGREARAGAKGGFWNFIYLFIVTFPFLVFGFTEIEGPLPTVPHLSLIPQTLFSLSTHLLKHLFEASRVENGSRGQEG